MLSLWSYVYVFLISTSSLFFTIALPIEHLELQNTGDTVEDYSGTWDHDPEADLTHLFDQWINEDTNDNSIGGDYLEKGIESQDLDKRGFQPWGGKRDSSSPLNDDDKELDMDKKRQFQPWGGKRGFQPWGGKRAFQPWGGKRGFQPWGGKRTANTDTEYVKKGFQPWGGKRTADTDTEYVKKGFQPWGGKRNTEGANIAEEKRGFQPWGGKRGFQPWGGKRSSFQPWGGKRGFQPWGGKRTADTDTEYVKKGFQPWGGKRNTEGANIAEEKRQFSPWGGKRGQPSGAENLYDPSENDKRGFQPWGGKRSAEKA